jgi:integrase
MSLGLEKEQERFTSWLQSNLSVSPSEKTLHNKQRLLRTLVSTYGLDIEDPDPLHVTEQISKTDISARTKKTYKTALKQFLAFRGIELTEQIEKALKHQRGQRRRITHPRDIVSMDELKDIVEHTTSPMLRAYYTVLWDTGARPGALTRLNVSDVTDDQHGFALHISKAKNEQSQRSVRLLTPLAIQYLSVWWSIHSRRNEPDAPLFINRYGKRCKVESLLNVLRDYHNERLGRGNGTDKAPLSLYLMRKSRATYLVKEKRLSEIQIKMRLGHKKHSQMLERYYAILDEDDQREAELEYLGVTEREDLILQPTTCSNCGVLNDHDATRCHRCRIPLSEEEMVRQQQLDVDGFLAHIKDDPDVMKTFAAAIAEALVTEQRSKIAHKKKRNS